MPSEHGVKMFPEYRVKPHIRLQQKLYRCVPQLPQAMAAVAAFIVEYQFVHPKITEIAVTAGGAVIARIEGEPTCAFISDYDDLTRSWLALLLAARLTLSERLYADALFAEKIGFYGFLQS